MCKSHRHKVFPKRRLDGYPQGTFVLHPDNCSCWSTSHERHNYLSAGFAQSSRTLFTHIIPLLIEPVEHIGILYIFRETHIQSSKRASRCFPYATNTNATNCSSLGRRIPVWNNIFIGYLQARQYNARHIGVFCISSGVSTKVLRLFRTASVRLRTYCRTSFSNEAPLLSPASDKLK